MIVIRRQKIKLRISDEIEDFLCLIVQCSDESVFKIWVKYSFMYVYLVSTASCELFFIKLKLMLCYCQASVGQERLSALVILNVVVSHTKLVESYIDLLQWKLQPNPLNKGAIVSISCNPEKFHNCYITLSLHFQSHPSSLTSFLSSSLFYICLFINNKALNYTCVPSHSMCREMTTDLFCLITFFTLPFHSFLSQKNIHV